MKYKFLLSTVVVLAISLAACAPATGTPTAVVDTPAAVATDDTSGGVENTPSTGVIPTDTEMAATETPSSAETPSATGNAPLGISQASGMGAFLVDANNMAVYAFAKDTQNGTSSACTGSCATTWLPVKASAESMAGTTGATLMPGAGTTVADTPTADASMAGTPQADKIDMSKIGSITLPDGTVQLTYYGWPLYHYAQDMAAGDTKGEGMESNWYLVSPSGEMIKE